MWRLEIGVRLVIWRIPYPFVSNLLELLYRNKGDWHEKDEG